jgi:CubicO group peptidase (beta-lactamase class C family)
MADPTLSRAWQHDTLVNVWSTTKGLTAIGLAMLVDRGQATYDDRVADLWLEFAAHGKGDVTIGQLISHQAGLTGLREPADITAFYDIEQAADRLARAAPFWVPGTEAGYHAIPSAFWPMACSGGSTDARSGSSPPRNSPPTTFISVCPRRSATAMRR